MENTRLNKYIAEQYNISRRKADELIDAGRVSVNNKTAELGQKVSNKDTVVVVGIEKTKPEYYAYYKPAGVVTTLPQGKEKAIHDITDLPPAIHPVGRLDKESEGLLIMTNDTSIVDKLLHPSYEHEKEYYVETDKPVTHQLLARLRDGVPIGAVAGKRNYKTKPTRIRKVDQNAFEIILKEGKNRQIRKMCGAVGFKVTRLVRFRILNIELDNLKPNTYRKLKGRELKEFLSYLEN
jgi:23S rRNA pseudouridine2604 synthase